MAYEKTEVYKYLVYLKKYLLGDLELFHKLAIDAEKAESETIFRTPKITIIPTTQYPFSFNFIYGAQLISRSTIPHTSVLFSTIDILGFLNRTGTDFDKTTKNFKEFFESLNQSVNEEQLSVLIKVYRHGITHSYFPKLGVTISYHSTNPPEKIMFKNEYGNLVLNVNFLENVVTKRLNEMMNDLQKYTNMDKQYIILVDKYEKVCRSEIESIKRSL